MGNSKSSAAGSISVVLDPPSHGNSYMAGDNISGSVYVQSKTNNVSSQQQINLRAYVSGK